MKYKLIPVLVSVGLILTGCQSGRVSPATQSTNLSDDVVLHRIAAGVWVHTTYFDVPGYGRTAANGLVLIDGNQAILVDLPWTDEQTAILFDWIAETHGAAVKTVIPTHFHQDCMGGLAEAHRRGAMSYGLDKTVAIARREHLPVPRIPYKARIPVRYGSSIVLMTYHGAGHTIDNVVAWVPKQRVLFGGCLIKSLDAESLGNTKDGDLQAYPSTVQRVRAGYPGAKIVVPGHGDWGGPELIEHTLKLCTASAR